MQRKHEPEIIENGGWRLEDDDRKKVRLSKDEKRFIDQEFALNDRAWEKIEERMRKSFPDTYVAMLNGVAVCVAPKEDDVIGAALKYAKEHGMEGRFITLKNTF